MPIGMVMIRGGSENDPELIEGIGSRFGLIH